MARHQQAALPSSAGSAIAASPPSRTGQQEGRPTPVKHWHAKQYQQSLCRAYTEESIRHLAAIMRQREDSAAARVQAANILLDRGWGKPPQAHRGEDGKNISVTIRQIVERGDED